MKEAWAQVPMTTPAVCGCCTQRRLRPKSTSSATTSGFPAARSLLKECYCRLSNFFLRAMMDRESFLNLTMFWLFPQVGTSPSLWCTADMPLTGQAIIRNENILIFLFPLLGWGEVWLMCPLVAEWLLSTGMCPGQKIPGCQKETFTAPIMWTEQRCNGKIVLV